MAPPQTRSYKKSCCFPGREFHWSICAIASPQLSCKIVEIPELRSAKQRCLLVRLHRYCLTRFQAHCDRGVPAELSKSTGWKAKLARGIEFLSRIDNRHLIAVDDSETHCRVWSLPTGKLIRTIPSTANPLAFSPDDRLALAQIGAEGKDLALMDVSTGKTVRRFAGADTGVFWPTGGWVLTGNDDMSLRLWNLSSGKEVRRIQVVPAPARPKDPQSGEAVQDHHVDRIQLSPSGRLVVTVDIGRNNVFDTATTKLVCELETPKEQPGLLNLFAPSSAEEMKADSDRFNDGTFWHRLEAVAFTADEQWIVGKKMFR